MALNKVAGARLGKFGSLTSSIKSKNDTSIFGNSAYSTVCSYKDSFHDISVGDGGSFDIFSQKGFNNLEKEKAIMQGLDKPSAQTKNFSMNVNSLAIYKQEINSDNNKSHVRFNS